MIDHEIHNFHTCFACGHNIPWTGDVFGGIVIAHGNEVNATISVSNSKDKTVELSVQLQCPECGAVNQFKQQNHK